VEVRLVFDFSMAVVFLAVGAGFVLAALAAGAQIRPRRIVSARNETYECGEPPMGGGWYNFNPRFYIMALVFLIFDVEVAITYPVVAALRRWAANGRGITAFIEIAIFLLILLTGLVFLWKRGDLEWIKTVEESGGEP
jgi:NADH-quinone oxidoreductase subunit A